MSQRGVYQFTNEACTLWNFEAEGAHVYYQGYKHKRTYTTTSPLFDPVIDARHSARRGAWLGY